MGVRQSIKSISFLWLGSLIGSGSTFLIYIILAREIGPAHYGLFSSAMAIMMIFSLVAGFGIPQVWLKFFGSEGWGAIRWVKPSLTFVGITLVFISLLVGILAFIQRKDILTAQLLLLLLFFVIGYISVQLMSSKLQLEERYNALTLLQLSPNLLRLVIIVTFFYLLNVPLSVVDIGWIYASVGIVLSIISVRQMIRLTKGKISLIGHELPDKIKSIEPRVKKVISEAWPFGFAGIFAFVYIQSDIIMVKYLNGNEEAGYYNVAFTILFAVMTIPTVIFSKYLSPKYHRWAHHDKQRFYNTFKQGNLIMLITGITILSVVFLLSSFFIPILFGADYEPSILLTNILSISIPFSFLAYSYGATLLTKDHMRLKVRLMGLVALFNVILNIILIKKFGAMGAAVSTVLSNVLLTILYRHYTLKKVFVTQ